MAPANEYHYTGGAGGKLWGQLEKKEGKRGETENMRTKTESKESSLPLVELTECGQLIEINVLSGWAERREKSRLAVRELDA